MSTGFIKLYRSMLEWGWYDDVNTKVLFLHLLLKANYVEKEWHGEVIKRGQLITSIKNLADELHLSENQVRNIIAKLKKTGEIITKSTNKFTLITIEKYGFYQDVTEENNKQNTNNARTNNKQATNKAKTKHKQTTNKAQQLKKERKK